MTTDLHPTDNWYAALITWFARNPVAANLLMAVLLVGGLVTAIGIKKEILPKNEINVIQVQVPYLGAAPQEVEQGICLKVEEAIQDLEGIEELRCTAAEGLGTVTASIDLAYDVAELQDEIKLRVDGIATFPAETEKPTIFRAQFEQPIMWLSVYGDVDERTLYEFAKTTRDEVLALPEVTRAEIIGARPYEISIEVSEQDLERYGLSFDQLALAVRRSSLDLPGGSIRTAGGDILLRTAGQAYRGAEFEAIVVRTNPDGSRVLLSDVARVRDGFIDTLFYARHNNKDAMAIRVLSVGDQSELQVAAAVREYIERRLPTLPSGISVDYWADLSPYLEGRLTMMIKNLLGGALLVFAVLALFLRFKLAFWVMVGLPIAFMGAFFVMPSLGTTVNMISLFGFILVLGIVVDDAIVIGESAYTSIRSNGHSEEAVVQGVLKVAVPATFGVLTTMAAFMPILTIEGAFRPFFSSMGWVVVLCLAFSLVESKLILPAHLVHMKISPPVEPTGKPSIRQRILQFQRRFSDGLKEFVTRRYLPLLEKALKGRYTTLALFLAALILSVGLLSSGLVRTVGMPDTPGDFIQADVVMSEGTSQERVHEVVDYITRELTIAERALAKETGLEPDGIVGTAFAFTGTKLSGTLIVELKKDLPTGSLVNELTEGWRERVGTIPGARQVSFNSGGGPPVGADLSYQLVGPDPVRLSQAAAELEVKIASYAGTFDVRNGFESGAREIQLALTPEAQALGLTLQDLARQVRQGFYGEEVQRIQRGQDEIRVMLRYPVQQRDSVGYLEQMRVRTSNGDSVPFTTVAQATLSRGPVRISRFGRQQTVSVTGEIDEGLAEPGPIKAELTDEYLPDLLARYPGVQVVVSGISKEIQRLGSSLFKGFVLALFLIYALMAIPLKSYSQPMLIMSVIPFGMIGAVIGHWIVGLSLSFVSAFGIVALAGVVVNDSLILVDYINRCRREGMPLQDAIMAAGERRFRPILLTSLTTFLGLAPIVFFERSVQATFLIPMATSLAFGIVFATVITLFLIPILCHILEDIKSIKFGKSKPDPQAGIPIVSE
ncbi:MAG: efflux RND transporter permease subunit [Lysobacterales bacterium]